MSRLRSLSIHYRTIYAALLLGTIVTLFVLFFLQNERFIGNAELTAYDSHFRQRPAPSSIVVVGLDDTSIQWLANGAVPIPRHWMANVVNYLHLAGARAIGIDFVYNKPSATAKDDRALAAAIKRAGNVVLAGAFQGTDASNYLASETQIEMPIDVFARQAAGVGVVNYPADSDSAIRRLEPVLVGPGGATRNGRLYNAFDIELASVALHKPASQIVRSLPNPMLINYVGPQDPLDPSHQSFTTVQFADLADGSDGPEAYHVFRNKIVLVVPYYLLAKDQFQTPVGTLYGGVVHANALDTILRLNYISQVSGTTNNLLIVITGLITTIVASRFGILKSAVGVVLIFAGYILLTEVMFLQFRTWINLVTPLTGMVLVVAAIMTLRFATEERQRRRASKIFGQYVKPEIVDILINAPDEEKALAGGRRPISVLFVDIRGFTRMSEAMEPEDVVKALDVYLEELTASVQKFDGTVDKYVGDEIMAIWNAPSYQDDHALRAVLCGLDMVSRMDSINQQLRSRGLPAVKYGTGINSGDVIVGQMGSSFRKQYDVVGDTVNTAARLCSAAAGAEIIIGQETWEMIGDRLVVEETEPLALKGKSRDFRTFRVIGVAPERQPVAQPLPAPA